MIKLRTALIQDPQLVHHLDAVRTGLENCSQMEPKELDDFLDDIMDVIEGFVRQRNADGQSIGRPVIDQLVVRVLSDCGRPGAANQYIQHSGIEIEDLCTDRINPTPGAVAAVLASHPMFWGRPVEEMSRRVSDRLKGLQLEVVTEALAVELAKSLILNQAAQPEPSYWVLRRSDIPEMLPADLADMVRDGRIKCKSVSALLPSIEICVNLELVFGHVVGAIRELALYPEVDFFCEKLLGMARILRKEICGKLVAPPLHAPRAAVEFLAFDRLADACRLVRPRARESLRQELCSIISHRLSTCEWIRYEVTH